MNAERVNKVKEKMDFLGFKDISTKRQKKNGTQIFELPIKCGNTYIKVGTFKSGYVRRMNHCYTPYQLNKCKSRDRYFKLISQLLWSFLCCSLACFNFHSCSHLGMNLPSAT